ncbi:MAG TPA: tRNA (adenosine(37)-N6)-threonylcarbamoyltransferase complex dimerization subunit type 1 TsaB [Chlamydiales bacterium]|nr:tRNA (adenosine(37)-N6)-threonylcarbamoyltransferase complex dimerization subunit type 1 TsaB [Chlamydiales bacterium]
MLILIIETSTEKGCLILAEDETPVAVKMLPGGPELSKSLALEVEKFKCKAALHLVAVGTGPGSYTGIRVGAALAKALAYGWQVPLLGFCSLKAFTPNVDAPSVVLVDARMGGFYALIDQKPALISPTDPILQTIPHIASPHPELVKKRVTSPAIWHETEPNPHLLAKIVYRQFLEERTSPLELTYLSCP